MSNVPKLLLLWLVTALSLVGFVARFNIVIDPFGYFGANSLGYYFSSERQFKFSIVKGYDYNAIILGDSRIAFTDPSYVDLSGYRFVNGGIAGATICELVSLLAASRLSQLRLAVVGLEYGIWMCVLTMMGRQTRLWHQASMGLGVLCASRPRGRN
jgi:hypothetical protein